MIFHQFFLAIISVFIYLKGYLPMKQNDFEVIKPPSQILDYKLNVSTLYKPRIERLIFVIIDALREDFVTLDNMPFTYQENNRILKVKVEAPTVTLPRIKALTTGGIPQFVDIILNLGATTKCDDSFLDRAKAAGLNMIFFGDDTWIRMYPDLFMRMDGTTSFFVNDFKEVDDNVTRHLDEEMLNDDWDIMFLHYLGFIDAIAMEFVIVMDLNFQVWIILDT
ncbi:PREDICTED: GPI ethanolamine phosphate transferase 2-like [Nicrophorus vespilloides]|uniref:GPI ethanolamine phosphate transferase 2-like n=1 Tax=Nicrophorus vespilloides TaxID=110193 RepID=A0ABM1MSA8_NICVS|nr:PREDICTED: GPI ethanolamine phosphate transferase 2-like [Nicrophorus vespilloides]